MVISPSDTGNQKHLTLENRIYIENELNKGTSFKDIARFLCKDPTTISKEIRSHSLSDWYYKGTFYNAKNFCIHRYHCKKIYIILRYCFQLPHPVNPALVIPVFLYLLLRRIPK